MKLRKKTQKEINEGNNLQIFHSGKVREKEIRKKNKR